MSDEIEVPDVSYESIREVQYLHSENLLHVAANGTHVHDPLENVNEDEIPEEYEGTRTSVALAGGIEELHIGAFSEDASEVMSGAKRMKSNDERTTVEFSPDTDHLYPDVRFRERHGKLVAVVTFRNYL